LNLLLSIDGHVAGCRHIAGRQAFKPHWFLHALLAGKSGVSILQQHFCIGELRYRCHGVDSDRQRKYVADAPLGLNDMRPKAAWRVGRAWIYCATDAIDSAARPGRKPGYVERARIRMDNGYCGGDRARGDSPSVLRMAPPPLLRQISSNGADGTRKSRAVKVSSILTSMPRSMVLPEFAVPRHIRGGSSPSRPELTDGQFL
jgi:hypothetical protein